MSSCSITSGGSLLFVVTSNGWHRDGVASPLAPSFLAVDKRTGAIVWSDRSPGMNILHGQWSSPAYGVLGKVPQVIFPGGDGWLYAFDPKGDGHGRSKLLWKFDCNPKTSRWILGGRGSRNNIIAMPVLDHGRVYIAVGQEPEHGEGKGHLWCIDPTKRGDVSPTLAVDKTGKPIPHRRLQAVDTNRGERTIPNKNSAVVWHFDRFDMNGDGKFKFEETMHRSVSNVAIKNNLLFASDFSGLLHCLDARTGRPHWPTTNLPQRGVLR